MHSTTETKPINSRQDRTVHSRWISFPFLLPQLSRIARGISSDPANRAISFHGIAIRSPSPRSSVYAGSARESIATDTGSASLSFPNVFLRCRGSARRNSAVSEWSSRRCSTVLVLPSQDQRKARARCILNDARISLYPSLCLSLPPGPPSLAPSIVAPLS